MHQYLFYGRIFIPIYLILGACSESTNFMASGVGGGAPVEDPVSSLVTSYSELQVFPASLSLAAGTESEAIQVLGLADNSIVQDLSESCQYQLPDDSTLLFDKEHRVVFAKSAGESHLAIECDGLTVNLPVQVSATALVGLEISPSSFNLPVGENFEFYLTGIFADGTTQDLTGQAQWSSENPSALQFAHDLDEASESMALVSSRTKRPSIVKGMKSGSTKLRAELQGIVATAEIKVSPAELISLLIVPDAVQLIKGLSQVYQVRALYSDLTEIDISERVQFKLPGKKLVERLESFHGPTFRAVEVGEGSLEANYRGKSAKSKIIVKEGSIASLQVVAPKDQLVLGEQLHVQCIAQLSDGSSLDVSAQAYWQSSDSRILNVSNATRRSGLVTALREGKEVAVKASLGKNTAEKLFHVVSDAIRSVAIQPGTYVGVGIGETHQFQATAYYASGATQDVTEQAIWSSSDVSIASVDNADFSSGLVLGRGLGLTKIKARFLGMESRSTTLHVVSASDVAIEITPPTLVLSLDKSKKLTATLVLVSGSKLEDAGELLTWTSSDNAIVSVSNAEGSRGTVTAHSRGVVTIKARLGDNDIFGESTVSVPNREYTTLSLSATSDRVQQERTNLIFAVDNSASMGAHHATLANKVDLLLAQIFDSQKQSVRFDVDVHVVNSSVSNNMPKDSYTYIDSQGQMQTSATSPVGIAGVTAYKLKRIFRSDPRPNIAVKFDRGMSLEDYEVRKDDLIRMILALGVSGSTYEQTLCQASRKASEIRNEMAGGSNAPIAILSLSDENTDEVGYCLDNQVIDVAYESRNSGVSCSGSGCAESQYNFNVRQFNYDFFVDINQSGGTSNLERISFSFNRCKENQALCPAPASGECSAETRAAVARLYPQYPSIATCRFTEVNATHVEMVKAANFSTPAQFDSALDYCVPASIALTGGNMSLLEFVDRKTPYSFKRDCRKVGSYNYAPVAGWHNKGTANNYFFTNRVPTEFKANVLDRLIGSERLFFGSIHKQVNDTCSGVTGSRLDQVLALLPTSMKSTASICNDAGYDQVLSGLGNFVSEIANLTYTVSLAEGDLIESITIYDAAKAVLRVVTHGQGVQIERDRVDPLKFAIKFDELGPGDSFDILVRNP